MGRSAQADVPMIQDEDVQGEKNVVPGIGPIHRISNPANPESFSSRTKLESE